ncbi:MAG: iron-containing alcohol dehydrogenase [Bacilli bacterium]
MENINQDVFDFYCPTRIIYRPEGVSLIGKILKEDYGFKKAFLIYGGKSLKESSTYQKIVDSLQAEGILFEEYSGISVNPDIQDVRKIIDLARIFQPEIILACGGGSVLDTAKSVANGYYYDGNPLDFNKKTVIPLHALKVATIITLAASGSEMSDSCVISDREHNFKSGFNYQTNRPLFSLLDPTLTYSVSPYQTSMGLVDMFSHSFERFFSPSHEYEPCDDMALAVMKNVVKITKPVLANPNGYEERRSMMLCSTLAHNGFTSFGKKNFFRVHAAEHKLSGVYPQLTHGQGIALLMPEFLTINKEKVAEKIAELGNVVLGLGKDASFEEVLISFDNWLASMPMYHSFSELPYEIDSQVMEKAEKFLHIK